MYAGHQGVDLPVDVQENIIANFQKIFPDIADAYTIRDVLITHNWDLEESLRYLHGFISNLKSDEKNIQFPKKKRNPKPNRSNLCPFSTPPGNKQFNYQNPRKLALCKQNLDNLPMKESVQPKKGELFKKGPATKDKLKEDLEKDWVFVENKDTVETLKHIPNKFSDLGLTETNSDATSVINKCYNIIKHFGDVPSRINSYITSNIRVMIMLRGCSGSGKSTYAREILQKAGSKYPENHIFSTDNYFVRQDGSYWFNRDVLEDAHEWNQKVVELAAIEGRSPIFVDNTNTRLWEMQAYARIAVKYGYILETVEPPTPWFFNEDILFRKNKHAIPRESIRNMLDRYEANLTGEDVLRKSGLEYSAFLKPPQVATAGIDVPMSKKHKQMLTIPFSRQNKSVHFSAIPTYGYPTNNLKSTFESTKNKTIPQDTNLHESAAIPVLQHVHLLNSTTSNTSSLDSKLPSQCFKPQESVAFANFSVGSRKTETFSDSSAYVQAGERSLKPANGSLSVDPHIDVGVSKNGVNMSDPPMYVQTNESTSYVLNDSLNQKKNASSFHSENISSISLNELDDNSSMEYVLISTDQKIIFQKYHFEVSNVSTLEDFQSRGCSIKTKASTQPEVSEINLIEKSQIEENQLKDSIPIVMKDKTNKSVEEVDKVDHLTSRSCSDPKLNESVFSTSLNMQNDNSNLEYVLVSADHKVMFQKHHFEIQNVSMLDEFQNSFINIKAESSLQSDTPTTRLIEKSQIGGSLPNVSGTVLMLEKNGKNLEEENVPIQSRESFQSKIESNTSSAEASFEMPNINSDELHKFNKVDSDNFTEDRGSEILNEAQLGNSSFGTDVTGKENISSFTPNSLDSINATEKSTSSSNASTLEHGSIEKLSSLFPSISREQLIELFGTTSINIDWAVGLLLDSGHDMVDIAESSVASPLLFGDPACSSVYNSEDLSANKGTKDCSPSQSMGDGFNISDGKCNSLYQEINQSFSEFLDQQSSVPDKSAPPHTTTSKSTDLYISNTAKINNDPFNINELNKSCNDNNCQTVKGLSCVGAWDYTKEAPKAITPEQPKDQRISLPRFKRSKSVGTNTNYADFELLRNIMFNNNIDHIPNVLMGNPNFVSSPTKYFPSSSILMLEKSTMTANIETNQLHMESGIERLALMFPQISRDNLAELFEKCQKDIDWVVGLLLDSGQEISELYTSLEPAEDLKVEVDDKNSSVDLQETSTSNSDQSPNSSKKKSRKKKRIRLSKSDNNIHENLQKLLENNFTLSERQGSSEHMKNDQKTPCRSLFSPESNEVGTRADENEEADSPAEMVEDEVIFMLDRDFILQLQSRFGGLIRPNMLSEKNVVSLPLTLARQLHSYVMDSVQEHIQEESLIIDEDEEYARQVQEEEIRSRGAPSLLEIMDEEVALRRCQKESNNGKSLASTLSKQLLLERFPKMDPVMLANILDDTNHSLHQATYVLASAGHEQAQQPTQEPQISEEKESLSREEAIEQATAYGDVASQLYELRKNCLKKSQKAFREGNHSVALYYSDMARWYMERIEKSNSMAAKAILAGYEGWTTLDLHFLQVAEALNVLDLFVDEVIRDLKKSGNRKTVVFVITGRGIHSAGGRPRLKPAVQDRLAKRDLKFVELNPGMLKVTIPRTALTSYQQVSPAKA